MRPGRLFTLAVTLSLGVALVGGCSSDSNDKAKKKTNDGGVTTSSEAAGTPVAIVLGDTSGTDGPMTLTVSPASVPAGPVTFSVENAGTVEHELVVLKDDTAFDALEINADGKVSESTSVGESEVEEGETKSLTLDLEAGNYILACNIKDHYGLAMRAAFTVT